MVLWLLPQAAALRGPHGVHGQPHPRHVPGQEGDDGAEAAGHVDHILQAEKKSSKLRGSSQPDETQTGGNRKTDRTTRLLIVILLLFLFAEVPQVNFVKYYCLFYIFIWEPIDKETI